MKRFAFALCAAAAVAAVPALAVDAAQDDNLAGEGTPTPDEDIKCATWAAFIIGTNDDPVVKEGYSSAMAFFLGRYEGATGKAFQEEMARVTNEMDEDINRLIALDDVCPASMEDFVDRLSSLGDEINLEAEASGQ